MRKVWQSRNDACLRAAAAMVLDKDYRHLPDIRAANNRAFWSEWMAYLTSNGINMTLRCSPAPHEFFSGPWIAVVPSRCGPPVSAHAIVMDGRHLFHDPDPNDPRKRAPQKIAFGIELIPERERA